MNLLEKKKTSKHIELQQKFWKLQITVCLRGKNAKQIMPSNKIRRKA
jgi:hypothetical protein